jgi:hypothetical protein
MAKIIYTTLCHKSRFPVYAVPRNKQFSTPRKHERFPVIVVNQCNSGRKAGLMTLGKGLRSGMANRITVKNGLKKRKGV